MINLLDAFEPFKFQMGDGVAHKSTPLSPVGVVVQRLIIQTDCGFSYRYMVGGSMGESAEFLESELLPMSDEEIVEYSKQFLVGD